MNLNNILKSELKKAYLLYGSDECYAITDYIVSELKDKFAATNINSFTVDRYFDYNQIFDIINNQSLFNDKNYIELKYSTKPTVEHQKQLIKLISLIDEYSLLIVTTDKLTKKDISAEWVKQFASIGMNISITDNNLLDIINYKLSKKNISIENTAINELMKLNQNNTTILLNIINQLEIIFTPNSTITQKDIIEYNQDNSQYSVYELSSAYLLGDLTKALKIFNNVYEKPEDAILLIWLISEDIRKLLKIKALQKQKLPFNQIMEQLKIWGSQSNNWQRSNDRLAYTQLISIFNQLSELDMIIKGIKSGDIKITLTLIIKQICAK